MSAAPRSFRSRAAGRGQRREEPARDRDCGDLEAELEQRRRTRGGAGTPEGLLVALARLVQAGARAA